MVPETAPGRSDGRVVPTATSGAAPSARTPGFDTIAPPTPNSALSTPVNRPISSVRASRSRLGSTPATCARRAAPPPPRAGRAPRRRRRPLVGGVYVVLREHHPEVDAVRAQGVRQRPLRPGAALTVEQRLLAEGAGHGPGGGPVGGMVQRRQGRLDPAEGADRDLDVVG